MKLLEVQYRVFCRRRMRPSLYLVAVFLMFFRAPCSADVFIDEMGREVDIPPSPRRIVSLAPNITESLFALGLDKEIAGVTMFSDYPSAARSKPKVGSFINVSVEKIVALGPDLVIATANGNKKETILHLADLGFPVYVIHPECFEDIFRSILNIGRITGREGEARKLVETLRDRVLRVISKTGGLKRPRVFFQIGIDPIVSVGKDTIHNRLITIGGGTNITGDVAIEYPRLNIEKIISAKPDIIIISSMKRGEDFVRAKNAWEKWKDIPAVKNNRIHIIDSDLTDHPSPRIVDGLEQLARYIHPEAMK
jgi:iron complex transport system substrate-binding protein